MLISFFSISFDDYEMMSGINMKFRLDDFYVESFRMEIGFIMKFI